ncbi:AAA family ATPase [Clostridium sp. D2Q-11]|uniref:AAA family ATPase n=1 Tax=Anaeromonas frigoriresistens TaxID=2683708 RepID=A0A942USR6_9FIRM|nr:AAA family ATPase [Anaeromonas frigoriresistens]MBS4538458.1 AAA family ATPase [Anaeromonas frigoriresistens]
MKFVVIFGPHAVGKMTVGQELAKITGLKLFHNHMTIDLVSNFFNFSTPQGKRLVNLFRQEIFEEVSKSDLDGMIFTYMWAFDDQEDWDYINEVCNLFESRGSDIYFVELEADFDMRIERNKTPNRLANKPTKRDIEHSENLFRTLEEKYRLNSYEGEIKRENYMRINNTKIPPEEVAKMIKNEFSL